MEKAVSVLNVCGFSLDNLIDRPEPPRARYIFYINEDSLITFEEYEILKEMSKDAFELLLMFT